jgi:hypothetical protein
MTHLHNADCKIHFCSSLCFFHNGRLWWPHFGSLGLLTDDSSLLRKRTDAGFTTSYVWCWVCTWTTRARWARTAGHCSPELSGSHWVRSAATNTPTRPRHGAAWSNVAHVHGFLFLFSCAAMYRVSMSVYYALHNGMEHDLVPPMPNSTVG